jgi:hypothetical protein
MKKLFIRYEVGGTVMESGTVVDDETAREAREQWEDVSTFIVSFIGRINDIENNQLGVHIRRDAIVNMIIQEIADVD